MLPPQSQRSRCHDRLRTRHNATLSTARFGDADYAISGVVSAAVGGGVIMGKFGRWSWRDIYRLPLALILMPLVKYNYWQRERGIKPDEWYWADALMLHLGYAARS